MFNVRLLPNGRYHGNRMTVDCVDMLWTWWDTTTQFLFKLVRWYSRRVIQHFPIYRPSASWIGIVILDHPRIHGVRLSCQNVVIWGGLNSQARNFFLCEFNPPLMLAVGILRFYDFSSLAGKCLTTPPFFLVLGGLNSLKLWVAIKTPKVHPCVRTRHLSHKRLKSVEGFELGAIPRKKYNHDRTGQTGQQSQNRNI